MKIYLANSFICVATWIANILDMRIEISLQKETVTKLSARKDVENYV